MTDKELVELAAAARKMAYAPYSHYQVGAALLTELGDVYTGCNIENSSYGATNCAERTAFFTAVSEGVRDFSVIAIVGGPEGEPYDYAPPCGICRQVMSEFCGKDFRIILGAEGKDNKVFTLGEILPESFTL